MTNTKCSIGYREMMPLESTALASFRYFQTNYYDEKNIENVPIKLR